MLIIEMILQLPEAGERNYRNLWSLSYPKNVIHGGGYSRGDK